ncbi:DNA repair protein XRCC1 [Clupea harengus]|uniref:DNA repair protein XRCC1 n=1 Tax=Clupea harengus TaxID=7950 RepID=A0A6P3VYE8_CLUHA|nr:DNA repair protein XRCC1 [Clupea harengus]
MPEIKLKHVVSCSTEDNTHKADNLLSSDTYRKWKAARPGEKQTSVIIQFEKEEQVHSIDLGNEGSAFIEVLVGHSTSVKDQNYEVLLVTSSFMSPTESRAGTNTNRVRIFSPNQLVKATAQEKWDRVKIVCSQPYSKTIAYGLAFVKFHSPPDNSDPPSTSSPKLTKLGQFRLKEESPSLQPGSLFFSRETSKASTTPKVSPQNDKLSYAAATLKSESASPTSSSSASSQAPVKRKFEFSKERQEASGPPSKKPSPAGSPEAKNSTPKPKARPSTTPSPKASSAQKTTSDKRESSSKPSQHKPSPSPKAQSKPKPSTAKDQPGDPVPLKSIMEGVVFVLSGFQNPLRGELRDKALAMGAKYRTDWTPDSTHLICAFANTPKYTQVKAAGGLIVCKEWMLDCHSRKQKISYKRYLMDGEDGSSDGSEVEDDEESEEEQVKVRKTPEKRKASPQKPAVKIEVKEEDEDEDGYGGSTDADEPDRDAESGMDTEDELKRVETESKHKKREKGERRQGGGEEDPYGGSTDENTDAEEEVDKPIPELPEYLKGKHFYLYGKFPNNERRLLQRYIIAFNGTLEDYMGEKVQFVITSEGWHDSFEDALMENANLSFVKPKWIFAINDRQKMLPHQPYAVVPV